MDMLYHADRLRYEMQKDDVLYCTVDGDKESLKEVKELCISLLPAMSKIDKQARLCAVHELLETKNDSWLEEDEEPITAEVFVNRLKLTKIEFDFDGITFWYEDDDLFWGHAIMVVCDNNGNAKFSELMG